MPKVITHFVLGYTLLHPQLRNPISNKLSVHCLTTYPLYIVGEKAASPSQWLTLNLTGYYRNLRYLRF